MNAAENRIEIKKMIGYLPESAPLYPDMLVLDYLIYLAEIREVQNPGRINEVADICRIRDVMHKAIGELSKGYKQRVGLAHAIMHDPGILILDEPTSGLDPIEIIEIRNLIRELGKKKTVILSTHILPEVEATCNRVIIINSGRIVADDSTEALQSAVSGEKRTAIKVSGTDFDGLKGALAGITGVKNIMYTPDAELISAMVISSGDAEVRPEIFRSIASKGWVLYEMKQEHASLETIFRDLTVGGGNEKIQ